MSSMYDILAKMKLLEGKASKPDFLDLDKDGNKTEPMKSAAKGSDVDESALQAYLGKKKYGETGMKALQQAGRDGASKEKMAQIRARHDKMDEADMEEGNRFTGNLMKARAAGLKKADLDGDGDMEAVRKQVDELDMKLLKGLQGAMSKTHKDSESERNIHKKYGYRSDRDDTGNDDDYDEHGNLKDKKKAKSKDDGPKKKGRPSGTGRKLGAKGPTGRSKLMSKEGLGENDDMVSIIDKGEYDREGEMAKDDLESLAMAAKELHAILGDDENLPEWVQSKITKALDYINSSNQYMHQQDDDVVAEKAVSKKQQKFMGMVHAAQKGEKPASKEVAKVAKTMKKSDAEDFAATKHKGLPDKKKKEVDETTVSGSVATAPASAPKGKNGMQFGKGVYEGAIAESFNKKLKSVLTEGMSINASQGENGEKSLTITATDDDAIKLAQILQLAGMQQGNDYHNSCPSCGQQECGCEGMAEGEYANSPDVEVSDTDMMVNGLSGGLNGRKSTGQTTIPVLNRDPARQGVEAVAEEIKEQAESRLWNLYKKYDTK